MQHHTRESYFKYSESMLRAIIKTLPIFHRKLLKVATIGAFTSYIEAAIRLVGRIQETRAFGKRLLPYILGGTKSTIHS